MVLCSLIRTFANMERKDYEAYMEKYADEIEKIRQSAYDLHKSVNQTYGDDLPYGYHLDMVVQGHGGRPNDLQRCEEGGWLYVDRRAGVDGYGDCLCPDQR